MRKIEAFIYNGKEYIYHSTTTRFKTCQEFKLWLNLKYPLSDFKCNFERA